MCDYLQFIKLANKRLKSHNDYIIFQQFQASNVLARINRIIDIFERDCIDLGCGNGGYAIELARYARTVYAVDLNIENHFADQKNVIPIRGNVNNLPFRNESIDFVFCSSLIEHIPNQDKLLSEINRILRSNSFCYLSFPPFYSPVGGHQFKPYHLLGEGSAIFIFKKIKNTEISNYSTSFGNWGLYPTTIHHVVNLVKNHGFKIKDISTRFSPINVARIPILNEFLTWHVEFILQKGVD